MDRCGAREVYMIGPTNNRSSIGRIALEVNDGFPHSGPMICVANVWFYPLATRPEPFEDRSSCRRGRRMFPFAAILL
jgi:hypothetical protein